MLHYRITPINPEAHLFEVVLTVERPNRAGERLYLPAWIPGSYMIRDFARHIVTLTGEDSARQPLRCTKIDKQSWQCDPAEGPIRLRYQIYAFDLSVRSAHLDASHGYFNATSLCLSVADQAHSPHQITLLPPPREYGAQWRVATTLPRIEGEPWQFGKFEAAGYEELIDHPVEMGTFTRHSFTVADIEHHLVITGRHDCDCERLLADLRAICAAEIALFGSAPFKHYLFQLTLVGQGYGGLEHRSSTSLIANRTDLPWPGMGDEPTLPSGYSQLLGLCAHEYFHSWNVKQIKPQSFIPYQLAQESYTTLLWWFEGVTSYYDDLFLCRSETITIEAYLELLGKTITQVAQGSGRLKQSVAESSFDAWSKFYQQNENAPNAIVSYYSKGSLIALALDLSLRLASDHQRSLDSVLRYLWHHDGQTGVGVSEADLYRAIQTATGIEIEAQLSSWVHGYDDLPLASLLLPFGVALQAQPLASHSDSGGESAPTRAINWIGIRVKNRPQLTVTQVLDQSPAQFAGVSVGDRLLALNGLELTADNWEQRLNRLPAESEAMLTLFRDDLLLQLPLTLRRAPDQVWRVELLDKPTASQQQQRQQWLRPPLSLP
ncbi:M61 family peptidase [Ectothiorhodospiraceae bacterium BW-2]|nr:M61 family peptidase [Ectothiorhodospiraceae bacterium BW-2]